MESDKAKRGRPPKRKEDWDYLKANIKPKGR